MNRKREFDPRIDIIRFFAFFLVFFTHFVNAGGNAIKNPGDVWWNNEFVQGFARFGGQGVPIFFALTGFLLGRLLIREFEVTKSISLKSFYLRRIYRIWPLYFFFLLLCIVANPFATGTPAINASEIPYYLSFTYNWGQIFANLPGSMATITWSVSVEEQIYLIFPLLISIFKSKRFEFAAYLLIFLGLSSLVLSDFGYLPGHSRLTSLYLLPVGIGLFAAIKEERLRNFSYSQKYIRWVILIISLLYITFYSKIADSYFQGTITMLLTSIFFIGLIYISDQFVNVEKSLSKVLARFGRVSYGCYLYHWAVWTVMTGKEIMYSSDKGFSIYGVIIGFITTVAISEISYRYFESWFLMKRKRYQVIDSP